MPTATPRCGGLKLKSLSLAKTKTALKRAGCRIGTVKRPKTLRKGFVLVVGSAKLAKGSSTKVNVTLVAKRR